MNDTKLEDGAPLRVGRRRKGADDVKQCRINLVLRPDDMRLVLAWLAADRDARSANAALSAVLLRELRAWDTAGRPAHDGNTGPFAAAGGQETPPTATRPDTLPDKAAGAPKPETDQTRRRRELERIRLLLGEAVKEAVKAWAHNNGPGSKNEWKARLFTAAEAGTALPLPPPSFWAKFLEGHTEDEAAALRRDMEARGCVAEGEGQGEIRKGGLLA